MAHHLLTLGVPLLLTEAGEPIRFRTRKHFALLIRLATEAGKKLTRDYLMDLLWPDAPAHLARHSLAQALTVVKEKVGREHLQVQRATIALAEDAVSADLRRLDGGAVQVRGPFLDGFDVPGAVPFEQWKDEWRARLMPRIRDCLVGQMDAGRRVGDFAAVERHAQMLLDLDPLSEDAVRGLMEARAWVGDRSNALKVYGRFERRLAEELGARPGTDLARIAGLLREGRRPASRPAAAGQVPERSERRFEAETLIGRETEFACLYDAWLEVRRRAPRIMVLVGDPGVGKTTLTNAFVSTCQMDGAVVARAQAYDAERELPFAVLAELVKQLTAQRAIGAADPEALSELSRVSPEIFAAFPGVPKPVEWSAEVIPLRLADSFLKAVAAAAEESPLVLVVDDVHAADSASAAILHVVGRKLPRTRLLLILTARSNELRTAAGPSALVSDTTIAALHTLDLEPLSPEAAERMVAAAAATAERSHADVPVARILQAGNGNPLALELLTREWLAHGPSSLLSDLEALNTQPVVQLGIPRAIGAVFERQIRRLDAPTRAALDLAAVLGRRLADLVLYEVVGLSPAAAGEALSRLKDEGLLREVHGGLEFRNELIRAQAYYAVAGPARQHLHKRTGEVLSERTRDAKQAPTLEIAWHFLRGGHAPGALPHALDGAEAAIQVGAPYESEQILTALLHQPCAERNLRRVQLLLARALLDQSKADAAIPLLDALGAESHLSFRDRAEATRLRAAALYLLNRDTTRWHCEAAGAAVEAARKANDRDLVARALFEFARSGVEAGDETRVCTAQREIDLLLTEESSQGLHTLWYARGYCHYFFYELQAAAACIKKAIALLSGAADVVTLCLAYNALGVCHYYLCEFPEAEESLNAALSQARKTGDDFRASTTASNLCSMNILRGNFNEAVRVGRLSLNIGIAAPTQPNLMSCYTNLAEAYMLSGQREMALQCLEAAKVWIEGERSWRANVDYLCETANIALMMGDLTLALQLIERVRTAAEGRERAVPEAGAFVKLMTFFSAHLGDASHALQIARDAREKFRARNTVYFLEALAATAWAERRHLGSCTDQTARELVLFDHLGASGLKASLTAQRFL
jgi:DNA-binding SARP family transcriptional activator/tetratricopeptide (TPR) repeat protein